MSLRHLLIASLGLALLIPAAAPAATGEFETRAMHAGVLKWAQSEGASARSISLRCGHTAKVGKTGACTGSFVLARGGHTVRYRLTARAAVWRNTPNSYEYRVHARGVKKLAGVPREVKGFMGFWAREPGKP
jgi:hypothetical protein